MYCGIDVSKGKSSICILDLNKKIIAEFNIEHNKEGFEELERHLTTKMEIGIEVTGNYCKALYMYLKERYNVCYVDNLQLKTFAKLRNPDVKNDKLDARLVAMYVASGFKKINVERVDELKDLSRLYQKTLKQLTRYKLMFKDQVNVIFPELDKHFFLAKAKAIPYLLLKFPTPEEISRLSFVEIKKAMTENLTKYGSLTNKDKMLKKIKELAGDSIGVQNYPVSCFKYTIRIMLFYQDIVNEIKKKMKECLLRTPYCRLLDKFGLSDISLSTIVGEVRDIRRFGNYKKFVKYIGFDVSEKQSGSYTSKNCFITKRGNSILRFTFYNLVLTHLRYKEDEIAKFYYRLKEAGKHAKKCHVAAARKLAVKTYYDMLKCHKEE